MDKIHALEGMCSLAANGAASVKGGNWQVFEQFVAKSGAQVFLNTTVSVFRKILFEHMPDLVLRAGKVHHEALPARPLHRSNYDL